MSTKSLRSQLQDDYLTCSICYNSFNRPKALPCLHTYCESCLRDYIVSRGYESSGSFPCPGCRTNTTMPAIGVEGFPDNHVMSSLSDTVANSEVTRPTPKPRRSIGPTKTQPENDEILPPPYSSVADTNPERTGSSFSTKVCSNDSDQDWMIVPQPTPSAPLSDEDSQAKSTLASDSTEYCVVSVPRPGDVPKSSLDAPTNSILPQNDETTFSTSHSMVPTQPPPYDSLAGPINPSLLSYPHLDGYSAAEGLPAQAAPIGWNINILCDNKPLQPAHPQNVGQGNSQLKTFSAHDPKGTRSTSLGPQRPSHTLYPTVPASSEHSSIACTENLVLKFGKQGSSVRDFMKPVGLAVSKEGNYIISDSSGDKNIIFIYNSGGELTAAFNCGCKVKDVTMTRGNEILAAVHKNVSAIRHFTMVGQFKGEYGKFFTYEEPCGIGQLANGGVALTGTQNHCIYVLTDRMKLATKFGRKGNGDGYFQYPAYIAVDSKNQILVTDKINNCVQVFNYEGKFKHRFGVTGNSRGQLEAPLGICVDSSDNIIVADSGNCRVEVFSSRGHWLSSVVTKTHELGDRVKPVNVAITPTGKVAVLLRGPYFAEVRVYTSHHKHLVPKEGIVSTILSTTSAIWFSE